MKSFTAVVHHPYHWVKFWNTEILPKGSPDGLTRLRNKAAHSEYDKYESEMVRLMLAGVRHLISQFPA